MKFAGNLRQDTRCPDRDSNRAHPEYESGALGYAYPLGMNSIKIILCFNLIFLLDGFW
jgi:hypothetical protein